MFSLANKQTHRHMPSNQLSEHYCAGDCLQSTLEYFQISFQFQHQSFLYNLKLNYKSLILTPHQPRIKCWNILSVWHLVHFSATINWINWMQQFGMVWLMTDRKNPSAASWWWQWSYIGWLKLNPLSPPNRTLAPQTRQARASGEILKFWTTCWVASLIS